MPTISVIIPVYKVERYLDACVASVVGQTYPDLEIILVDDGSPDNCPALCDAWAAKDTRIRVIHRSNGGLSAARNSGLDICTGEYIAFVDSDDRLEPETLERALRAQQRSCADLVLFHYLCTDENDQPLPDRTPADREEEALTPSQFWEKFFASGDACTYYVVAWNKLYRAELFHTLRYAEGKRYEDMFLLPNLIGQCREILCLNFRGYRYAQRTGSIMSQGDPRNYLDRSEYLLEWTTCFAAKGDYLRAEGLLNDAIENLAEKARFALSPPAQQQRYRTACRACADAYRDLAQRTGRRSMLLRAALLRLGLPVYQAFLKHKA